MNIKKIFAIMLLPALISCSLSEAIPVSAAENTIAEAVLGTNVTQSGFERVESGTSAEPISAERGGSKCWILEPSKNEDNVYINFTFESSFKSGIHNGSIYDFEVEYYDSGKGFFALEYDSENRADEIGGMAYTSGTNTWKTAAFSVDDAFFYKRIDNKYDFRIGIKISGIEDSFSDSAVAVRRVRVTRKSGVNPIYVTSSVDESGNTFAWYQENKIIHNKLENVSASEKTVDVRFRLIGSGNRVYFDQTQSVTLPKGKSKNINIDAGEVTNCDVYRYVVSVTSGDGAVNSEFNPFNVAIVKTDPKGILNDDVMFAAHLEWYGDKDTQNQGVEMIKKSNSGGIRSNFDWASMESDGTLNWDNHNMKNVVEKLKENGLKFLPVMSGPSLEYCAAWNEMPKTDTQLAGWRKYIRYSAEKLKEYGVTDYEIWNEPNLSNFNLNEDDGAVYAALFKASAEEIHDADKNAKVGGPAVTGINGYWGRDYFVEAMDAGLGNYADAITLHSYTDNAVDITGMDKNIKWFADKFVEYNSQNTPEIWNTESGYSTADDGIDERTKGALNSRAAILYKALDLSDKVVLYNFEKKGIVKTNKEHQYGHVSPASKRGDKSGKSFVPEVSYAMITGMNYVMAETVRDRIIDSDSKNVRICSFDSGKFGSKLLALYSINESECVTLNLGTDKVTYYDALGNSTEIYGKNGMFTFAAGKEPAYIVGDIKNTAFEESGRFLNFDASDIETGENEFVTISIEKYADDGYTTEVILPQNMVLARNAGFTYNTANITLKNAALVGESGTVTVLVKDGERIVACYDVNIKTVRENSGEGNVSLNVFSDNAGNEFDSAETIKFDVVYGNQTESGISFTAKYDLYRCSGGGDELIKSSSAEYAAEPYGVACGTLIIPETEPGSYKLKITALSDGSTLQEKTVSFKRTENNGNGVFHIKGNIPSGRENRMITLTVFDESGKYNEDVPYCGIYNDQGITGINGIFDFKIRIPSGTAKAYVVSEDGDVTEFDFMPDETQKTTIYLVNGLVKADGFSIEKLIESGPEYLVEWKHTKSGVNYDIYCALYSGGRLVSVSKIEDFADESELLYKKYRGTAGETFDKIKIIVWKHGAQESITAPYEK